MRVLHLTSGNMYGGIERVLTTLAEYRHAAPDMEPHFGVCFPGRQRDELAAAGVPVHDLGAVRVSRPWTVLAARRRLRRVLAGGRFDAAVTHGAWPHAVFAPAARRAGVRLVRWVHNPVGRRDRLEGWAARTPPDRLIANSRFTADSLPGVYPGVPADVLWCPVPAPPPAAPATRGDVRAELGTPAAAVVVLIAARLDPWKGHRVLLAAMARLAAVPGWVLWVAGGPHHPAQHAYLGELRHLAAGLGDRVVFLGERPDVPRLLAAADVLCQPNTSPEPFGVALVEALYAGVPVVTADAGGGAEVVTPECGVRVPCGDAAATADAVAALIRDAARRAALGRGGPARARFLSDPPARVADLYRIIAA